MLQSRASCTGVFILTRRETSPRRQVVVQTGARPPRSRRGRGRTEDAPRRLLSFWLSRRSVPARRLVLPRVPVPLKCGSSFSPSQNTTEVGGRCRRWVGRLPATCRQAAVVGGVCTHCAWDDAGRLEPARGAMDGPDAVQFSLRERGREYLLFTGVARASCRQENFVFAEGVMFRKGVGVGPAL